MGNTQLRLTATASGWNVKVFLSSNLYVKYYMGVTSIDFCHGELYDYVESFIVMSRNNTRHSIKYIYW